MPECFVPQVLGAEQVVAAGPGHLEPLGGVAARQHVGLHAKLRDVERVDHVFGGHRQADVAPHRNVEFVDLARPRRVLELPHPLLADDVDVHRLARGARHVEVDLRAPAEHDQRQHRRDDGPRQFERHRRVDLRAHLARAAAPVADGEEQHQAGDDQDEEGADDDQEQEQQIHLAGGRRRAFREQLQTGHDGDPLSGKPTVRPPSGEPCGRAAR